MSELDSGLLTALKKKWAQPLFLLTVSAPGDTLRYGYGGAYSSETNGHYAGKIIEGDSISSTITDPENALQAGDLRVTISDTDRRFSKIVAGARANEVRGSAVTIKLGEPTIAAANWATRFSGRLTKWSEPTPLKWVLTFRNDDLPLVRNKVPRVPITASEFPLCPADNLNKWAPIVYGKHTSSGFGGKGAVTLILVDPTAERWLVSVNGIKAVDQVYINGTAAGGGTWSLRLLNFAGILWSVVEFSSSPPADSDTVTADVRGHETVGDGSGTLIENPIDILKHFLENYVWNDARNGWYPGGVGMTVTPPLNSASFTAAATFFTAMGAKAGLRLGGGENQSDAKSQLNDFCRAWEVKVWWRGSGQLTVDFDDHQVGMDTADDVYPEDPLIVAERDALNDPLIDFDDNGLITRVTVRSGFLEADSGSRKSLEVRDPSLTDDISDTIDNQWVPDPSQAQLANRLTGSRRLFLYRRPRGTLTVDGPVWLAGTDLMTDVGVVYFAYPTADGSSPGRDKWSRALYRVYGRTINPMTGMVTLTLRDVRQYLCGFREIDLLRKTPTSDEDGNARLDRGTATTRTLTRSTVKQVLDPSGVNRFIQIAASTRAFDSRGLAIERARPAELINNSFTNWTGAVPDSWTVGSYANGSALAKDTADLYFDVASTGSAKFTAGNPHTTENVAGQTTGTTFSANAKVWVLVASKAVAANGALFWRLRRQVDNFFWNHGTQQWQAGTVDNTCSNSAARILETFGPIDVGGSATTVRLSITQPSGGTASRENFCYHADVQQGEWPALPIVTTTVTVTTAADVYTISNNSGSRAWPNTRHTAIARVVPLWSSANSTVKHTVFYVAYDANNYEWIYYDADSNEWKYEVKAGGTLNTATLALAVTAGTTYDVVVRRVSSLGEYGLAAHRFTIFVNSSSASATANAAPTQASPANIEVGSKGSGDQWDGFISYPETKPLCLTDEEMQAAP